ncbi:MAG: hypothetical protein V4525_08585 [Pseudomonadota bacterium]
MKKWIYILWPSFLVACMMEMAVFSLIDPIDIPIFKQTVEFSHQALYSLAFFTFWFFSALSSWITLLLVKRL